MSTLKMTLTNTKIKKRLIWIRALKRIVKLLLSSFTHKTSKRRDILKNIYKLTNELEREVRRDIRPNGG